MTDPRATLPRTTILRNELLDLPGEDLLLILCGLPKYLLASALEFQLRPSEADLAATDPAPGEADTQMVERRLAQRTKTLRQAKIIFNNKMSVVDCQVSNVSETGCLLKVEMNTAIPRTFTLRIANSNVSRECEVVWRNQYLLGLYFIG